MQGNKVAKGDTFAIFQRFTGQSAEFYVKKYKELVQSKLNIEHGIEAEAMFARSNALPFFPH